MEENVDDVLTEIHEILLRRQAESRARRAAARETPEALEAARASADEVLRELSELRAAGLLGRAAGRRTTVGEVAAAPVADSETGEA